MLSNGSVRRLLLLVVFSLLCLLNGHKILVLGKNGDGLSYAAIGRNMAEGYGTFWAPYTSDTILPVDYEHPPFIYWIQSIFFRIFGDSVYFEGVYGFGIALVILGLTALLWKRLRTDFQLETVGAWWPCLLLLALPCISYFFQSHRLMVTFVAFALLSVYLAYQSFANDRWSTLYAVLAGATIYGGLIAKGPVALFALAVPAIGFVTFRKNLSRAIFATLIALGTTAAFFSVITFFFPLSIEFWYDFINRQVVASLLGNRSAESYTYYYTQLGAELSAAVGVIVVLMLLTRVSLRRLRWNRHCTFFLLVALAGSLPFFFSPRSRIRYILHSVPFYVLVLAFLADAVALKVQEALESSRGLRRASAITAGLCILVSIGAMIYQKDTVTKRHAYFEDIYLRNVGPPERTLVSVYPESLIYGEYLFTYMQRFQKLSLTKELTEEYIVVEKNSDFVAPRGYTQILAPPTRKYHLYRRSPPKE